MKICQKYQQTILFWGDRPSSMVSSAPTILWLRVQIQSTPFKLFSLCIIEIIMRKEQKYTKRGRDWPILKNQYRFMLNAHNLKEQITILEFYEHIKFDDKI